MKAEGLSFKKVNILLAFLWEMWKEIIEEKCEVYLGHSVSRWACDWNLVKHVHPRGLLGKKQLQNSPVGACPATSLVKRLNKVMPEAIHIKTLLWPSHAWGRMCFFFIFKHSSLLVSNGLHIVRHSLTTATLLSRMRKAMVICSVGKAQWEVNQPLCLLIHWLGTPDG